jgi:hypothetical protein
MSFVIYFAMLIAALVSVVMGLEVVSTPPVKTAKPALMEPIRHAAPVPVATPSRPSVAQQPASQEPRQTVSQSSEPDAIAAPESTQAQACNVQACEAAYRSFTASDCTYQPFDGPRRLCTK